jgi:hypothetical protein
MNQFTLNGIIGGKVALIVRMARFVKIACGLAIMIAGINSAWGFALYGPFNEPYQVTALSYGNGGDEGAPKNLGEEYRWNTPVLYYSFDAAFLDYFGSNGVYAVDQAFAILNSLTNVSSYSHELTEFPLESSRVNFEAQALQLIDIKSLVLNLMIEKMGLAEPDRFVWTLHNRVNPPGSSCPVWLYQVIKRNFDPLTWEPSSYVNGTLFSYNILEFCPALDRADAVEFLVDPLAIPFSAVASLGFAISFSDASEADLGVSRYGFFYTGLTRDDVGGLRYLLRTNNMNFEQAATNALQFATNANPQVVFSSNLTLFAQQALTNGPGALQALYPNLAILNSSNYFQAQFVTNFIPFFSFPPWAPAGVFTIDFITNVTPVVQSLFQHTFGNLAVFQLVNGQWTLTQFPTISSLTNFTFVTTATIVATNAPFSPTGTGVVTTNVFTQTFVSNQIAGEFVIFPSNFCDVRILATILTNVTATITTNSEITLTNGIFFSQLQLDFSTNHAFVVLPVVCVSNSAAALRQGIEKMTFIRRDFDSLLGRFFEPVTNDYSINSVTNSRIVRDNFRRIVTVPDILITAQDEAAGPNQFPPSSPLARRTTNNWNTATVPAGVAGPGTIDPGGQVTGIVILLNKVGPMLLNLGPNFIDEASASPVYFVFGSFDGTTNAPIVYPSYRSIVDMENQVLMQVSPRTINVGTNGDFNIQLTGAGGSPPYTWAVAPGSSLPNGLTLSPSGEVTGTASGGAPVSFVVRMTDIGGRHTDEQVTITFVPDPS